MDSPTLNDFQVDRLNEQDKSELRQFLVNESQRARIQSNIHTMTEVCFKKCVTGTIKNGSLDGKEQTCMSSCADRFFDITLLAVQHLGTLRK